MVAGDETPFFVMELIAAAEPIVQACDRRQLNPRGRRRPRLVPAGVTADS